MSAGPGDLANLADLALPPPVSFWPPAAGIWVVAAASLAALTVFGWRALRRYRANAYLRQAIAELDALSLTAHADEATTADTVSTILKRVALIRFGRPAVASLTGTAWAGFIARTAPQGVKTDAIADHLARAATSGSSAAMPDRHLLFAQAKAWLHAQRGRLPTEA